MSRVLGIETSADINQVVVIRQTARNFCYFGCGAIKKIDFVVGDYKERKRVTKWLVITTKGAYKTCGAWKHCLEAFEKHKVEFFHYDKVSPNPNLEEVEEAAEIGRKNNCHAILAIGGGSPIDAAKNVSVLLANKYYTCAQSLKDITICQHWGNQNDKPYVPLIVINTTHGTGTEVDMFAVVSATKQTPPIKPALGAGFLYPEVAIDDPELMLTLPPDQTLWTTIDALNHVNEACTTIVASPYAHMMGREVCDIIAKYLPIVLKEPQNVTARYYLTYAAAIAGICFDNAALHLTHALEHPLSAYKPSLAHGLGLAMILPAVNKIIWKSKGKVLADLYHNILPGFTGALEEEDKFYKALEGWLKEMGIDTKLKHLGFKEEDIPNLIASSNEQSLHLLKVLAPCWPDGKVDDKICEEIYKLSMDFMK